MSGTELNPQISQISQISQPNAVQGSAVAAPPGQGERDAELAAGFSQLVQRVARLEALVNEVIHRDQRVSGVSRPAERSTADLSGEAARSPVSEEPGVILSAERMEAHSLAAGGTGNRPEDAALLQAWHGAPLPLRLKFARELLPADHPLQPILQEAVGLEELRCKANELETWLNGYPSLFADAVERLERQPACGDGVAERLALTTLEEARQAFAATMAALGIEWIQPGAGAVIGEECEVVGETAAPVPAGRAAELRRRGFRQKGKLALPAQVTRSAGNRDAARVAPAEHPQINASPPANRQSLSGSQLPTAGSQQAAAANRQPVIGSQAPAVGAQQPAAGSRGSQGAAGQSATGPDAWPNWLRTFQQRSVGCELPVVKQLQAVMRDLAQTATAYAGGGRGEAELAARLEPLLPLLGARYVPGMLALPAPWGEVVTEMRDGLLSWLGEALGIVVIAPEPGAPCDTGSMQISGVRRTAHPHEDGTVARVERIGLRRGERVLFRAQVLRYEMGSDYD
jgi:hypothetical protein